MTSYYKKELAPYYPLVTFDNKITITNKNTITELSRDKDNMIKIMKIKYLPNHEEKAKVLYVNNVGLVDYARQLSVYVSRNFRYLEFHNAYYRHVNSPDDLPGVIGITLTKAEYKQYKMTSARDLLNIDISRFENKMMKWYKNGALHRDNDAPAYIQCGKHLSLNFHIVDYDFKAWAKNGQFHRDNDEPTVICRHDKAKYVAWHRNGVLHKDDGPAFMNTRGVCKSYYNGTSAPHKGDTLPTKHIKDIINMYYDIYKK